MSAMLYLVIFVKIVTTVDPIMETIDEIIAGQKITLSCPIKGISQSGMFRWLFESFNKKENKIICTKPPGEVHCTTSKLDPLFDTIQSNIPDLIIDKVSHRNSGTYQCKYIDETIIGRYYFHVTISTPPNKPQIYAIPSNLTEGQKVNLICKSEGGNPKPTLEWLWKDFSNVPIVKNHRFNSTLIHSNISYGKTILSTFWIPKAFEDGYSLSCQAKNSLSTVSSNWMYLNINYPPVIYDFYSKPFYGLIGSDVHLECKASSKSRVTFRWMMNNGRIISDDSYLIINPLRTSDKGSYICVVSNSFGSSSATLDIKVISEPIIKVAASVTVYEGETLNLICNVVPSFSNVTWWLGNRIISITNELKYDIEGSHSFEIQCQASVFLRHHGNSNIASCVKTVSVIVYHIPQKPIISANPTGILLSGSYVTLTCIANKSKPGLPKPNYLWKKKNSSWMRNGTNFLTLSSLTFEDSGTYGCILYNKLGSSEENYYVLTIEGPPIIRESKPRNSEIIFAKMGRTFKIECEIQGKPIPSVYWYRNENIIKFNSNKTSSSTKYILQNDSKTISILTVDEPNTNSEDKYQCIGKNKYGTISRNFIIKVIFPPKLISGVLIIASNIADVMLYKETVDLNCTITGSPHINVSWIRKLMDYNEKIIENDTEKYSITEKYLRSISGIESILHIKYFQNEDYGRYVCLAKNSEGHVEANFEIRKFAIPDPAYDLIVVDKTLNSLSLKWIPGFNGGYSQIFTVSYSSHKQKHPFHTRTEYSNITLNNLLPDLLYYINISSSNKLGTSTSILSIKTKTRELMIDRDFGFTINKDEKIIELSLPQNITTSLYCLTIEAIDIQKDITEDWSIFQKCMKSSIKKIVIHNPQDRFRLQICLTKFPDVCSDFLYPRLELISTDGFGSTKLIGTIATICTALVIILAILVFFVLIRPNSFLPVITDLKVMRERSKFSSSPDVSNFKSKSLIPVYHEKEDNVIKDPVNCHLLNDYACDKMNINNNPIEIINVCPKHNLYVESLYSIQTGLIQQPPINTVSSCCCYDDKQANIKSISAFKKLKSDKIVYEVMV